MMSRKQIKELPSSDSLEDKDVMPGSGKSVDELDQRGMLNMLEDLHLSYPTDSHTLILIARLPLYHLEGY
jgi:hypothetical protein